MTQEPPAPSSEPHQPHRVEPAPDAAPYDLAPEPATPPPPATPPRPPGKLSDKSFIDEFPEDADLESDPEVERALRGQPPTADTSADQDDPTGTPKADHFIKPGGDPQVVALIGAGIAIAAAVMAGVRNPDHWFYAAVLAVYMIALNTVTGVAAGAIVAYFERSRFGRVEHAAARMLVAVAVGHLVLTAGAGGYNVITAPLGIASYLAAIALLFRFPPPRLVRVAAVHAAIIAAQYFAMILYAAAAGK